MDRSSLTHGQIAHLEREELRRQEQDEGLFDSFDVAVKLAELITKAPAGGLFHESVPGTLKRLHVGCANEATWFNLVVEGKSFIVQVERYKR